MARRKEGWGRVDVEMPEELLEQVRLAARQSGVKVTQWIAALCAKKLRAEYTPPTLGRPPERLEPEGRK